MFGSHTLSALWTTLSFLSSIGDVRGLQLDDTAGKQMFASIASGILQSSTGGAVRALAVGIDEYQNVNRLAGSKADAEDISESLQKMGVVSSNITILVDEAATRKNFVAAMNQMVEQSKPGDLAIITYSGHATRVPAYKDWEQYEPGGKSTAFLMVGYGRSGVAAQDVIVDKELMAWLSRLDRKNVDSLVVADCSLGGSMVHVSAVEPSKFLPVVVRESVPIWGMYQPMPVSPTELTVSFSDFRHVTFLGGLSNVPEVDIVIDKHIRKRGTLSYSVARAVGGAAIDGTTRTTSRRLLINYVRESVRILSDERQLIDVGYGSADGPDQPQTIFKFVPQP